VCVCVCVCVCVYMYIHDMYIYICIMIYAYIYIRIYIYICYQCSPFVFDFCCRFFNSRVYVCQQGFVFRVYMVGLVYICLSVYMFVPGLHIV
jgi:hypothetical protein